MNEPSLSRGQKLLQLLTRRGSDRRYKHPRRDTKDLLCLLILSSGIRSELLPAECQRLLGEFALKVGYTGKPEGLSLSQAVKAYFIRSPLDPDLLKEFRAWAKEELGFRPPPSKGPQRMIRA